MAYHQYLKATFQHASRSIIGRNPVISSTVVAVTCGVSYAYVMEYNAERTVSKWNVQQQHQNQLVSASNDRSAVSDNNSLSGIPPPLLPRVYDWDKIYGYWSIRPVSTVKRIFEIMYELTPVLSEFLIDFVILSTANDDKHTKEEKERLLAIKLREALTNLGPAFVKAGQQLSIRPDLVSAVVLKELQQLCDSVRPISDDIALQLMKEQLQVDDLNMIFTNTPILVASASLGQVYKATIRNTGNDVAIKIQRPKMLQSFSLDLFLLQHIGIIVDKFTSIFTNQPPFHQKLYESFANGSYSELDYENEAKNQIEFYNELKNRNCPVIVPKVYNDYTTQYVLTTEWINGIKLSDASREQINQLIPIGVDLFLTQLLDIGKFHSGTYIRTPIYF